MLRIISILVLLSFFISSSITPAFAAMTYLYDQNGNMTSDGTKCYEYNEANQLRKVKKCSNNQTIAEYVYDYNGKRLVRKEYENGTLKRTVYSPDDEYETVKKPDGTTEHTTYYKANDEVVAKKNPDGSLTYYHNDHLGSNSVLTNQSGTVVEKTTYEPYGEVKSGGTKSKFGYTGQEKDLETDLNYYEARYYDPHIHHFTQPDDIIQDPYNPQDLNRYAYVRNNPLKYTDPTGHVPLLAIAVIGGVLGAGAGYTEVRLSNPQASFTDYAWGISVGTVAGVGAAVAGVMASTVVAIPFAGTALAGGVAATTTSNIAGGMASGFAGNGIKNLFESKNFLTDAPLAMTTGGVAGGLSSGLARQLVPAGQGALPNLNFSTSSNVGPNTLKALQRNTVDTGVSNILTMPINVNAAKNKNAKSTFSVLVDKVLSFFKPTKKTNVKKK